MPGGDDGRFDCAEIKNGLHKLDRGARFFEYPVTKEKGRRNVIIQVNPLESKVILSIPSCLPRIPMDLSVVGVVATQTRGEGGRGKYKKGEEMPHCYAEWLTRVAKVNATILCRRTNCFGILSGERP